MLKVKINIDLSKIKPRMKERFGKPSKGLEVFTMKLALASTKYMPAFTGDFMARSMEETRVNADYGEIVYSAPFARFLWHGKLMIGGQTHRVWARKGEKKVPTTIDLRFHKEVNPLAQARWFDAMKRDELDFHVQQFQKMAKDGEV